MFGFDQEKQPSHIYLAITGLTIATGLIFTCFGATYFLGLLEPKPVVPKPTPTPHSPLVKNKYTEKIKISELRVNAYNPIRNSPFYSGVAIYVTVEGRIVNTGECGVRGVNFIAQATNEGKIYKQECFINYFNKFGPLKSKEGGRFECRLSTFPPVQYQETRESSRYKDMKLTVESVQFDEPGCFK